MLVCGEEEVDGRRCKGWDRGSTDEGASPMRLSTDKPNCTKSAFKQQQTWRDGDTVDENTHPPSMVNEFLPVDLVQPCYSDVIPLSGNKPSPQLFILPSHSIQHGFCGGVESVRTCGGRPGLNRRERAAPVDSLLLGQAQCRDLAREPVDMALRLGLEDVLELDLLLSELCADDG